MVVTILLTAMAALVLLLLGAVYSALIISHKTDEIIRQMNEEPASVHARRRDAVRQRSVLGNA